MVDFESYEQPPERRSLWPTCLGGCLLLFIVLVVAAGLGVRYVVKNAPDLAAAKIAESIDESDLPDDQKTRIKVQVGRIATAFKNGQLNRTDFPRVIENIVESPIMGLIAVSVLDEHYLRKSGLSEEEKEEAVLTIQRVMRGVLDEKLEMDDLEEPMKVIAEKTGETKWRLKNQVSDDELRQFIGKCRELADDAEVEAQPEPVDLATEIEHIVDGILEEGAEQPEGTDSDTDGGA